MLFYTDINVDQIIFKYNLDFISSTELLNHDEKVGICFHIKSNFSKYF